MSTWKLRGKCTNCRKMRWFVRQQSIKLPKGMVATSRELICPRCARTLQAAIMAGVAE